MNNLTHAQFDRSTADQKILEMIIDLNFYASKFYEFIQKQVQIPRMKGRFASLAMVHQKIQQNLKGYVQQRNLILAPQPEKMKVFQTRFLAKASSVLGRNPDKKTMLKISAAEIKCLDYMVEETKHSGASKQTKWMLAHQLNYLHHFHDYLRSLKDE